MNRRAKKPIDGQAANRAPAGLDRQTADGAGRAAVEFDAQHGIQALARIDRIRVLARPRLRVAVNDDPVGNLRKYRCRLYRIPAMSPVGINVGDGCVVRGRGCRNVGCRHLSGDAVILVVDMLAVVDADVEFDSIRIDDAVAVHVDVGCEVGQRDRISQRAAANIVCIGDGENGQHSPIFKRFDAQASLLS